MNNGFIIDSHCHVVKEYFAEDQEAVIIRAIEKGVSHLVNPGVSLEDADEVVQLAETYEELFGGVGIHPHEAKSWSAESESKIRAVAAHEKIVAIGECGLDFFYKHSDPEIQKDVLAKQVRLACELNLPVIIHCRDAWDECLDILEREGQGGVRGVFHCFTGGPEILPRINALDFFVSFSGIVTFPKSEQIQKAAPLVPMNRILVETDCPYLAPQKMRGRRNEPAFVWMVAEKIAELRGLTLEETASACAANAISLFSLPLSGKSKSA
jgi:TatD DNase family protein